ncbi:dihydrodipicolinate reductase [Novosphingobium mangrovi (ex Huang et al. 2023)]|uniref:Dihydrodipicolinate reductase n=1 Tax=Novosphingobium mangrovi (ex Huang et al. 2023) TaxID=2976432 RepID=A0ABT2I7K1_9SPHN|nr:dihydrodipicolinate reductase [Novosphingobium mangrovi (ex Huang et al. 2023)]MCT2400794.1 dihydrodipicolinate reductase [Novosphingobium mangrovi (ex Huang et al. 2023)]
MSEGKIWRVVQWATGNVGSRALRMVIEHPRMELAGLWVSSPGKVGKDAGALCGLPETGIKATGSLEEIVALDADCVLYMQQGTDYEALCALLASGKNVVTTRGDFHYPPMMDAANRARIEEACARGGSSIYSTGSSPGFVTEALAIPLLSLQREHGLLTIDEYADVSSRNSPEMLFHIMGFAAPMAPFDQRRAEHLKGDFGSSLSQVAQAIGLETDEIEAIGELSPTRQDLQIAAGTVPAGTVGAMRTTITCKHQGRPVLRFRANWYVTTDIEDDWDLRESGWRIVTEGDTPVKVDITFPVSEEDYAAYTPGLTAHRPINAIPAVCAAQPGIRTTVDLPQIIPLYS